MKWILIALYVFNKAAVITNVEFDTKESCMHAGQQLSQFYFKAYNFPPKLGEYYNFVCVPKG